MLPSRVSRATLQRNYATWKLWPSYFSTDATFETKPYKLHKLESGPSTTVTERTPIRMQPSTRRLPRVDKYPELHEYDHDTVMQYLEKMADVGITKDVATQMLLKYPPIQRVSNDRIAQTMMALRNVNFKEDRRNYLLSTHPRLVEIAPKEILRRVAFLGCYFENAKEVLDAIVHGIECLIEKEVVVKRKLDYLIKEVSHETKNIGNCNVLSYSLRHMITRHEFLIRAGLFKPINYNRMIKVLEKEKASKTERQKYFRPAQVVCSNDQQFLRVCTRGVFTINDLASFEEIFVNNPKANMRDIDNYEIVRLSIHNNPEDELPPTDPEIEDDKIKNSVGFSTEGESDQFYF